MKAVKITLAVLVVAAIGYFVWHGMAGTVDDVPPVSLPKNQFTEQIESEVEALSQLHDGSFCKQQHEAIVYHINDDFKNGRLGKNESENEQWQENLSSNLYAAYADKFIKQADVFFRVSDWQPNDLTFIRNETEMLMKSPFLKTGPVKTSFTKIRQTLSKYNEITGFISTCRDYFYLSEYRMADRFPISETQKKIDRANNYLVNNLDNAYVNNCTRLREGLTKVPEYLFAAHIKYLSGKITNWTGQYSNFSSQADYSRNLYRPLKDEIDLLDNDMYNVSSFDFNYNSLINRLNADNTNAYTYFSSNSY